jgi:rare lipoprotein A
MKQLPFLLSLIFLFSAAPIHARSATYYHPSLKGRRMANGQRYNPNAMTAASNKYPLGSRVKVTNRRNGKSVTVKITDRCGNCYIDLSPAAFKRLGALSKGRLSITTRRVG